MRNRSGPATVIGTNVHGLAVFRNGRRRERSEPGAGKQAGTPRGDCARAQGFFPVRVPGEADHGMGEIGVFSRVFPIFCRRMFFNDGANGRDRRNRMPERFYREAFRDEARLVRFSSSVRWETVFSFRLHGDSANV